MIPRLQHQEALPFNSPETQRQDVNEEREDSEREQKSNERQGELAFLARQVSIRYG